jgi:uncharacterized protein YfaT (DUF1175 family)
MLAAVYELPVAQAFVVMQIQQHWSRPASADLAVRFKTQKYHLLLFCARFFIIVGGFGSALGGVTSVAILSGKWPKMFDER